MGKSNERTELKDIINKRMEELGIKSQRELASRVGVNQSTISRMMGGRNTDAPTVFRLIAVLEFPKEEWVEVLLKAAYPAKAADYAIRKRDSAIQHKILSPLLYPF
jgi:plasmid maintenance system antidote protein VapI